MTAALTLHGLRNCDTCRKALRWLDEHGIAADFIDMRKNPPEAATLAAWAGKVGWDRLINRRGTTWRKLDDGERQLAETGRADELAMRHPALLKRPVITVGNDVHVGFDETVQARLKQG